MPPKSPQWIPDDKISLNVNYARQQHEFLERDFQKIVEYVALDEHHLSVYSFRLADLQKSRDNEPHTQIHWRTSQLADTMDPFTLKEALHRATMPFEYVHRAESRRIDQEEEADRIWA